MSWKEGGPFSTKYCTPRKSILSTIFALNNTFNQPNFLSKNYGLIEVSYENFETCDIIFKEKTRFMKTESSFQYTRTPFFFLHFVNQCKTLRYFILSFLFAILSSFSTSISYSLSLLSLQSRSISLL